MSHFANAQYSTISSFIQPDVFKNTKMKPVHTLPTSYFSLQYRRHYLQIGTFTHCRYEGPKLPYLKVNASSMPSFYNEPEAQSVLLQI